VDGSVRVLPLAGSEAWRVSGLGVCVLRGGGDRCLDGGVLPDDIGKVTAALEQIPELAHDHELAASSKR